MEVGQNARDLDRMAEIGVARGAFLAAMLLDGEDIGAVEQRRKTQDRHPRHRTCLRSEEHTSELQSLMRISYAVFCLKKKKKLYTQNTHHKEYTKHIVSKF